MTPEERSDPEQALHVLEALIPKRYLRDVLSLLARAVVAAHSTSPFKWSITLGKGLVRLNLGMIEVLAVHEGVVRLIVNGPRARAVIDPEFVIQAEFRSVPAAAEVFLDPRAVKSDIDLLWPAFETNLHEASLTPRHPSAKQAHSPGVLRLLAERTGLPVPNPMWVA